MLSVGIELKGDIKDGLVVNSDGFLRCRARGAPTLGLVVMLSVGNRTQEGLGECQGRMGS